MKLEELLNVMDDEEEIDIFVDQTEKIDPKTTEELFDFTGVSEIKNSPEYESIKDLHVWFVGRTFFSTIEIRIVKEGGEQHE